MNGTGLRRLSRPEPMKNQRFRRDGDRVDPQLNEGSPRLHLCWTDGLDPLEILEITLNPVPFGTGILMTCFAVKLLFARHLFLGPTAGLRITAARM
jgi:hypothetical protein